MAQDYMQEKLESLRTGVPPKRLKYVLPTFSNDDIAQLTFAELVETVNEFEDDSLPLS